MWERLRATRVLQLAPVPDARQRAFDKSDKSSRRTSAAGPRCILPLPRARHQPKLELWRRRLYCMMAMGGQAGASNSAEAAQPWHTREAKSNIGTI